MGDCGPAIPEPEREEDLIAAAKQIVRALASKKDLTDDAKKILADIATQLSNIALIDEKENEVEGITEIEENLNVVQQKIMSRETCQSMIWDSGAVEATEYLNAADEARKLVEKLETLNKDGREEELLRRSRGILEIAMARLEAEFKHILVRNSQPFEQENAFYDQENASFLSSEGYNTDSIISFRDDSVEEWTCRESSSGSFKKSTVDLVHPEMISDLRCIANLMFMSNYGDKCSQAYISVRREAMDNTFSLEMENLSIKDVEKLEWPSLLSKMKKWVRAIKSFVRVYLASEKQLTEQIFGGFGTLELTCFSEASKASMLQRLTFVEAICIGPRQPEGVFPCLDMYEVLADLLPDIDSLYLDDAGFLVGTECRQVLRTLGDSVKATFHEFENAIATNVSSNPYAGGGIHPLARYVMNHISILTSDYHETLSFLLRDHDMGPPVDEDDANIGSRNDVSPMARCFRELVSILECNLEDKAKLYTDPSLQHIFLVNNMHYIAQKAKNSELGHMLGDEWMRKCNLKFQQHATNYVRVAWSSVLAWLSDGGINYSGNVSRNLLKDKLRNFNLAFEAIYKTQTAWIVPDQQLREDLLISVSVRLIQCYRTFLKMYSSYISDKSRKYSADDLEKYLWDLFQGSAKSMHRR